jgi:hypothetical protein
VIARLHDWRVTDRTVVGACCAVAMLLAVVATWKGPGLSPDSVVYLSTGVNLADEGELQNLSGTDLTLFPPGLPVVAAFGELVGLGGEQTLRIVSVASFGAMVALGNLLLRRAVPLRGVVIGGTVLLAASPVLLGISKMAWT